MKNLLKRMKLLFTLFLALFISIVSVMFWLITSVQAEEETTEEMLERVTASDTINVGEEINIETFADYVKSGHYFPAQSSYADYTDIITKIIPEAFFYIPGVYHYIGQEWGFLIYTVENYSMWQSSLIIINFEPSNYKTSTGDDIGDFVTYRIENLLQVNFDTYYIIEEDTYSIRTPAGSILNNMYIADIACYARLLNENELNIGDNNYEKNFDKGDVIRHARLRWQGYQFLENEKYDWSPITNEILKQLTNTAVNFIPGYGVVKKVCDKYVEVLKLIEEGIPEIKSFEPENEGLKVSFEDINIQKAEEYDFSRNIVLVQYSPTTPDKPHRLKLNTGLNVQDPNGFAELEIFVPNSRANSRLEITYGFIIETDSYFFGESENGQLQKYFKDDPTAPEPYIFTHTAERKIATNTPPELKPGNNPVSFLEGDSFMIYKFNPSAPGQYNFSLENIGIGTWSAQILIFKDIFPSNIVNKPYLDLPELGVAHGWRLLSFNVIDNSEDYYLMIYYGQPNGPNINFTINMQLPEPTLSESTDTFSLREFTIIGKDEYGNEIIDHKYISYFEYTPTLNSNYLLTSTFNNIDITVHKGSENINVQGANCFLNARTKYIIKLESDLAQSGTLLLDYGNVMTKDVYDYSATITLQPLEKVFYKLTPEIFSGLYNITKNNENVNMIVFNQNYELPESWLNDTIGNVLPESGTNKYNFKTENPYFIGLYNNNNAINDVAIDVDFTPQNLIVGSNSMQLTTGDNSLIFSPIAGLEYNFTISTGNQLKDIIEVDSLDSETRTTIWSGQTSEKSINLSSGKHYILVISATSNNNANLFITASVENEADFGVNLFSSSVLNAQNEFIGLFTPDISGYYYIQDNNAQSIAVYNLNMQVVPETNNSYMLSASSSYYIVIKYNTVQTINFDIQINTDDIILLYTEYEADSEINNYNLVTSQSDNFKLYLTGESGAEYNIRILDQYSNLISTGSIVSSGSLEFLIGIGTYIINIESTSSDYIFSVEYADSSAHITLSSSEVFCENGDEISVLAGGTYDIELSFKNNGISFYPSYSLDYSVSNSVCATIENGQLVITPENYNNVTFILTVNSLHGAINKTIKIISAFNFSQSIQIKTDGYKSFVAYILTAESQGYNNFTLSADINFNNSDRVYSNQTFTEGNITIDISDLLVNTLYNFTPTVKVQTDNGWYEIPVTALQKANVSEIFNPSKTYSNETVYIKFSGNTDYTYESIIVPSSIKYLTIESTSNSIRGIYLDIESSSQPLVLNMKNIQIYAPEKTSAMQSERDIILNCYGTVLLNGGDGEYNSKFFDLYGSTAVFMHDNTLTINGPGILTLQGGDGADTANYQEYYYTSTAGSGGPGIEVGNLVINNYKLVIRGGDGGNGGCGKTGTKGQDGVGLQSNGVGNNGGNGGEGGHGCSGGSGGEGVLLLRQYFVIYTTELYVYSGDAGNGGAGGRGGDGGNGAAGKDGGIFGGQQQGGNGGRGGRGGDGGDYGMGVIAFDYINYVVNYTNKNFETMFNTKSADGIAGAGGKGGSGGEGGPGGTNTWGVSAPKGLDGQDGYDGVAGSSILPFSATPENYISQSAQLPEKYLERQNFFLSRQLYVYALRLI